MTKEDSAPGGLLSKVVRFVRNPTVNWGELDTIETDRESQYSKQVLKEMIERKRRNDFVRRREFDQLRKLRQRSPVVSQRMEEPGARQSFFQSSLTSPVERAVTIKKIDEIEAQMSMQWWKSKPQSPASAGAGAGTAAALPAAAAGHAETSFAATAPLSLPVPMGSSTPPAPPALVPALFADSGGLSLAEFGVLPLPGNAPVDAHTEGAGFTPAAEMEEFVHEPDLEEAAIRFANGDHAGAEAGLLGVLTQHAQSPPDQQLEIWMTLFDLYRATGQQDRFDTLALDFAARFSRSAPLWFSIPEQLGLATATKAEPAAAPGRRDFSWNAPALLTAQSVATLRASLERAAPPWTLVWSRLTGMEEAAIVALEKEFSRWAEQKTLIVFTGAEVFNALLEAHTQSGERSASQAWWCLRMAALRCMNRPDEFEMVALDYCVTYEVSPPSWLSPHCAFSGDDGAAPAALEGAPDSDLFMSGFALSQPARTDDGPVAALQGQIDGDATPLLQPFEALLRAGVPLTIACDRLIRVDFAAAGAVLNWAAEQQRQGHVVQFRNLQRLVAIFFNVIGINEHAWVIPRKN